MIDLARHELLEIEVLRLLKNRRLLNSFVFGGGTMLRLCYELNRYSVDLDFFLRQPIDRTRFLGELTTALSAEYEITDAERKKATVLCELRSPAHPRRLKLEFRTVIASYDYQQRIAFSPHATIQVILDVFTLKEALRTKLRAALDRKIIRDFFDIEFILRHGVPLQASASTRAELRRIIGSFTKRDYSTVLGSVLEPEDRAYYVAHGFEFLLRKLA
jgi:predicted nucleotidyltransferase component of viral defense system